MPESKEPEQTKPNDKKPTKRKSSWRWVWRILIVLVVLGVAARLAMPKVVRWYVNRTLDQSETYRGKIGEVHIHLWRGAYSIHDVRVVKMTGNVPVPLFSAKRVEFAMQWNAILHRKLVGQFLMQEPELNFVDAPSSAESQTGEGGPWLKIIQDLFPFDINRAVVQNGSVHFRTYSSSHPFDVYLSNVEATVDDLTNIRRESTPMITTVQVKALAMNHAKFEYKMKLDPFSYRPTFHMALRLLGLDVTKINDLALTYGKFDFKHGWFDLVMEVDSKEGSISGYVKPIFRDLVLFSLDQDIHDNPLRFFWQALLGVTELVLKNQPRNQFATLIPFRATEATTRPDILATIGNILRNAFIRAYLPKLQSGAVGFEGLNFDPPTVIDPISIGDSND